MSSRPLLRNPVTRDRLLLLALALLVLGSALGQRYPWHIDEVRFVGVALEMLQSGQWWVPHRAGQIYADKPPIFFWILGALFKLTGSVRWSFQLPAIVSGTLTLLLVHDLGTRLWHRRVGLCAALLLLACYQFWRTETYAHIDGLLLLWTTLGLYGMTRHLLSGRDAGWFYLGFAAVAAGVLSKGVGFLPLLFGLPYAWLRARGKKTVPKIPARQWLFGFALLFGLLLCWLLPLVVMANYDPEIHAYLNEILFRQTGKRYTEAWQHREPFWFFLTAIPKYWAPLSLLLPWLLPLWWRRLRRGERRYTLLLGWGALVLLFFSLSSGKRELYMLPALPAFALAAAPALLALLRKRWLQRGTTALTILLIAATASAGALRLSHVLPARSALMQWPLQTGYVLLAAAALGLLAFIVLYRRHALIRALVAYLAIIIGYHHGLMPLADAVESGRPAMAAVNAASAPQALALINWDERNWLYAQVPLLHNGIRGDDEKNLCSSATEPFRWLIPDKLARQHQWPLTPAYAVQPKDIYVVLTPFAIDCAERLPFRYRFAWDDASQRRLAQ